MSECVSLYWELILGNLCWLEKVVKGVDRRRETRVFHQSLLSVLEVGPERKQLSPVTYNRAGNESGLLGLGQKTKKSEIAYLVIWLL